MLNTYHTSLNTEVERLRVFQKLVVGFGKLEKTSTNKFVPKPVANGGHWSNKNDDKLQAQTYLVTVGQGIEEALRLCGNNKAMAYLLCGTHQCYNTFGFPTYNGMWVIDFDTKNMPTEKYAEEAYAKLVKRLGEPHVKTKSGGYHWFVYVDGESEYAKPEKRITTYACGENNSIEIRSDYSFVVIPPTNWEPLANKVVPKYAWVDSTRKYLEVTPEIYAYITEEIRLDFPSLNTKSTIGKTRRNGVQERASEFVDFYYEFAEVATKIFIFQQPMEPYAIMSEGDGRNNFIYNALKIHANAGYNQLELEDVGCFIQQYIDGGGEETSPEWMDRTIERVLIEAGDYLPALPSAGIIKRYPFVIQNMETNLLAKFNPMDIKEWTNRALSWLSDGILGGDDGKEERKNKKDADDKFKEDFRDRITETFERYIQYDEIYVDEDTYSDTMIYVYNPRISKNVLGWYAQTGGYRWTTNCVSYVALKEKIKRDVNYTTKMAAVFEPHFDLLMNNYYYSLLTEAREGAYNSVSQKSFYYYDQQDKVVYVRNSRDTMLTLSKGQWNLHPFGIFEASNGNFIYLNYTTDFEVEEPTMKFHDVLSLAAENLCQHPYVVIALLKVILGSFLSNNKKFMVCEGEQGSNKTGSLRNMGHIFTDYKEVTAKKVNDNVLRAIGTEATRLVHFNNFDEPTFDGLKEIIIPYCDNGNLPPVNWKYVNAAQSYPVPFMLAISTTQAINNDADFFDRAEFILFDKVIKTSAVGYNPEEDFKKNIVPHLRAWGFKLMALASATMDTSIGMGRYKTYEHMEEIIIEQVKKELGGEDETVSSMNDQKLKVAQEKAADRVESDPRVMAILICLQRGLLEINRPYRAGELVSAISLGQKRGYVPNRSNARLSKRVMEKVIKEALEIAGVSMNITYIRSGNTIQYTFTNVPRHLVPEAIDFNLRKGKE